MPLFLYRYTNKVDRKGRVSIPAQFRQALDKSAFNGVVIYRSPKYPVLDCIDWERLEALNASLDGMDMFSDDQDDLAMSIFSEALPLQMDREGRISLPRDLAEFAGITDEASFLGLGNRFQIMRPELMPERIEQSRTNVRQKQLTLKIQDRAPGPARSPAPEPEEPAS